MLRNTSVAKRVGPLAAFLCVALALAAQAQFTSTSANGQVTITRYTGPGGVVAVPGQIDGLPVTSILGRAFSSSAVTSVTIPNTVTNIGGAVFTDCASLTNVDLGSGVIGIGEFAFEACVRLASITIPESVSRIGSRAFDGCTRLVAITVEAANPFYASIDGVLFSRSQSLLIRYPAGRTATAYTIPSTVKRIEETAFTGAVSLANVAIPDSVLSIGGQAFGSTGLTSVTLPAWVVDLQEFTFSSCSSLTNVVFSPGLTNIGRSAFELCIRLSEVRHPNGVTSLGDHAFYRCLGLTNLTLSTGLASIGEYAFEDCTGLGSVSIPNSVTNIGGSAFYGCTNLGSAFLGSRVARLGDGAFINCTNLTGAYFLGNAPIVTARVFGPASAFGIDQPDSLKVYYLPGTTGWGATFANRPTALWARPDPVILGTGTVGVQANHFGFTISWAASQPVVVEAVSNLGGSVWSPVATNNLASGFAYFSDPQPATASARFYRVRPQ